MTTNKATIEVYTDGSATTGDLPGGWAFRVVGNGIPIFENSGHMEKATNNDAELEAALQGLEYLKTKYEAAKRNPREEEIFLVSDSQIVLGWASGKYRVKQAGKIDKVKRIRELVIFLGVKPKWVKGHSGDTHNTRCDKLARNARKGKTVDNSSTIPTKPSMIGTKKKGVVNLWHKGVLKIVDLESNIVEDYDPDAHGRRSSVFEVQSEKV
jgi:ribonuclease HI